MDNKKTIVFVLPRGEAVKNFVLSGTAAQVRQSAYLIIISIIPNSEIEALMRMNCDEFYELKTSNIPFSIGILWDWIDIVHGRWLWSGAAKLRWKIRDSEVNSFSKKTKRFAKKILAYPFTNRPGLEILTKAEEIGSRVALRNQNYISLLRKLKPDLVFNGSHIHSLNARLIMHAAKKLKITTATFLFSWDNLTSQGRILPYYDYYMVWNDQIKKDLLHIYKKIKPNQVITTGTPQFDFHFKKEFFLSRKEYAKVIGVDPNRPILLYTTGMLNLYPFEEIIVERIADLVQKMETKPQLVVRIYPKDTTGRYDALKGKRKDIIFPPISWELNHFTPMPEDLVMYSNMLLNCDVGINASSTVSLELCMFDKPVISIGYNPTGVDISPRDYSIYYQWDHYRPLTESGALDIAWSEEEMSGLIANALEHPELKRKKRKMLVEDFFGPYLDGKAYLRIAETLLEIAGADD